MDIYKIENSFAEVELAGSNLKSFKVIKDLNKYDLVRFEPDGYVKSFVMAPWVNRIQDGQFDCDKGNFNLLSENLYNMPHAIHGTVMMKTWDIHSKEYDSITLKTDFGDLWPYDAEITYQIRLDENNLIHELTIKNNDSYRMPFSAGWHPWFNRNIGSGEVKLFFKEMYKWELENNIPTSRIDKSLSFNASNGFYPKPGSLDDCFRIGDQSKTILKWPEIELTIQSSIECGHLVVYTPSDDKSDLICVEPQTSTINCFQLNKNGVGDTGILFLESGNSKSVSSKWSWS